MQFTAVLEDGTRLLFRLIRPDDKEMLLEGFEQLSERSRYERFFTYLETLSETQLRYLTEVDHENHSAWLAIAMEEERPRGVGVGRWIRMRDEPEVAEVAITVIDEFQRRGIGRTLLYLCATSALSKGVHAFRAWILSDNRATLHMLERAGAERGRWEAGVLEVTVPLAEAVQRSDLVPLKLDPALRRVGR
jgi:RimJ/RimL family protein N-acetyltransferase